MLDTKALAQATALIVREAVSAATAPLLERMAQLEARSAGFDDGTIRQLIDAAVAAIPAPQDGKSVTIADVEPIIAASVERAVGALPPAKDVMSITVADIEPLIADHIECAIAALPPVDITDVVESAVRSAVKALPTPSDGKSVTVEEVTPLIAEQVERAVAALPPAKDGQSVTIADVESTIATAVERAVASLPPAKDGVGLAGALIDRTGALVVTLSDGTMCELGQVEGNDGEPGLGFDDLSVEQTGERNVTFKFARGNQVKSFELAVPVIIDRGVFKEGQPYETGDAVTFGGSLWIAQKATTAKPDGPDTGWRLAVKKGRDGREIARD